MILFQKGDQRIRGIPRAENPASRATPDGPFSDTMPDHGKPIPADAREVRSEVAGGVLTTPFGSP